MLMLDRMLQIETQAGKSLEQQGNGDLRLGASERRPEAVMRTAAKGEMARIRPLDIEAVRAGVPRRVMAGREQRGGHNPFCLHLRSADLERLQSYPTGRHYRWVVA
jgi:hypothetical protein